MSSGLVSIYIYTGLYAEILQRVGVNLGYLKKRGASASSVRGSTGRQC